MNKSRVVIKSFVGEVSYTCCKHRGFFFKHWFKTFFVCVECGNVFTKKEIETYRKQKRRQS